MLGKDCYTDVDTNTPQHISALQSLSTTTGKEQSERVILAASLPPAESQTQSGTGRQLFP